MGRRRTGQPEWFQEISARRQAEKDAQQLLKDALEEVVEKRQNENTDS